MTTHGHFLGIGTGAGCRVWDTEGREYPDFVAGIATCTLGHAHQCPDVPETRKTRYVSNLVYLCKVSWLSG